MQVWQTNQSTLSLHYAEFKQGQTNQIARSLIMQNFDQQVRGEDLLGFYVATGVDGRELFSLRHTNLKKTVKLV